MTKHIIKIRPYRVFKNDGLHYVKINNKRVYIRHGNKSKISKHGDTQIVKVVVNNLLALWPSLRGQRDWAQAEEANNNFLSSNVYKKHPNMCEDHVSVSRTGNSKRMWTQRTGSSRPSSRSPAGSSTEKIDLLLQASFTRV